MKRLRAFLLLALSILPACAPFAGPAAAQTAAKTADNGTVQAVGGIAACDLSKMVGSAGWQGATGSLVGVVSLMNGDSRDCRLQGRPYLRLTDADGQELTVNQIELPGEPATQLLTLAPQQPAQARFVWRNWCGQSPSGAIQLTVSLPDYPGKLQLQVQDPNGNPLSDTPRCDNTSTPSTISVGVFQPGEP